MSNSAVSTAASLQKIVLLHLSPRQQGSSGYVVFVYTSQNTALHFIHYAKQEGTLSVSICYIYHFMCCKHTLFLFVYAFFIFIFTDLYTGGV